MYCKACQSFFRVDRHFHELFKSFNNVYFCKSCSKLIELNYSLIVMPLAKGRRLFNINIFNHLPTDNFAYFSLEYSTIYRFLKKKVQGLILFSDYFSEEELPDYEAISELFSSDIFVVSFLLKTF